MRDEKRERDEQKATPKQDRPDIYSNDDLTFESLRKSDRKAKRNTPHRLLADEFIVWPFSC